MLLCVGDLRNFLDDTYFSGFTDILATSRICSKVILSASPPEICLLGKEGYKVPPLLITAIWKSGQVDLGGSDIVNDLLE